MIEASLEAVVEGCGDPAPLVYARLFTEQPELEALFLLGPNARGHMLDEALKVLIDAAGADVYGAHFMASERVNHEQLGVDPAVFATFFETVRATFAETAGEAWTVEFDQAWRRTMARLPV